ncbi:MAG TPA: hypothetical protein VGS11_08610 [Candidatus Bathyarchaeia archaeon]|nr:hypothetical protein [Candidatus Bathyarchaeia archaeon]
MTAQASRSSYVKTDQFRRSRRDRTAADLKHKFIQTVGDEMFKELEMIADEKGIRVQTLLRAVIIPEWAQRERLSRDRGWTLVSTQDSRAEKRSVDRPAKV